MAIGACESYVTDLWTAWQSKALVIETAHLMTLIWRRVIMAKLEIAIYETVAAKYPKLLLILNQTLV